MDGNIRHISEIVKTIRDFANFINYPLKGLTYILYKKRIINCYNTFKIPKSTGGERIIKTPNQELKIIQQKLLKALYKYQNNVWKEKEIKRKVSHAFEKQKSIFTNARNHINSRFILNIDLENFFESFHFGRVRGFFVKNIDYKLLKNIATVIAQLTCYNGSLPQGAPTSPFITNLICNILDMKIIKLSKKYKLNYTRYADDLTFSTNDKSFKSTYLWFIYELREIIESEGFFINESKTRLQYHSSQQKVTGLVVNKKINNDKFYYRKTRAMANKLYTSGKFNIGKDEGNIRQLEGRLAFINQTSLSNFHINLSENNINHFSELNLAGKEKLYQRFLFYKYFFANEKPLIITEGKTDALYIKAALKSLYLDYPTLIEKKENGEFEFKIQFFRRSKRFHKFFGISVDGADTLSNIYYAYIHKKKNKIKKAKNLSLLEYFQEKCKRNPKKPVILIFDNESLSKEKSDEDSAKKPLRKFINKINLKEKLPEFKSNCKLKLIDNSNLFLMTLPLIAGKSECEIEDLFKKDTLAHKINGKVFSRDNNDTGTYYGKTIFSKYVFSNYSKIDFNEFRGFLNLLKSIIDGE